MAAFNLDRAKLRRFMIILSILLYAFSCNLSLSIRHGFLVDSFTQRSIPGRVFGIVEASNLLGYCICCFSRVTERFMRRFSSKALLISTALCFLLTNLATSLVFLLDDNTLFVVLSTGIRIIQGFLIYACLILPVDAFTILVPDTFYIVMGFYSMASSAGHAIADSSGCFIYDKFGYIVPFFFPSAFLLISVVLIAIFVPCSPTYLSTQKKSGEKKGVQQAGTTSAVAWLTIPMIITNAVYAFIPVCLAPYLTSEFNKSMSYSGLVLLFQSVGLAITCVVGGSIVHSGLIKTYYQMGIGAVLLAMSIFFTFPPPSLTLLYNNIPTIVFPSVILSGFGYPLIAPATLKAMRDCQLKYKGEITPQNSTVISSIWVASTAMPYYLGFFVTGYLVNYLSYSVSALVQSGCCLLTAVYCIVLSCYLATPTDERKRLLSEEEESGKSEDSGYMEIL